jgi:hypothetical protein
MWWMAAAWAGWSATVAVQDHGGPDVSWTVDTESAHPPVTWTGPDGELRRALVTGLYGAAADNVVIEVLVQTLRGRRWVDETKPILLTTGGEPARFVVGRAGEPAAWGLRVQFTRTEGPEVIWLSDYVAPGEAPPPRSLAIAPGLVCEGLEVAAEGATTRVSFPASEARSGGAQRWSCTRDAGATPVEVRLVVW